MEFGGGFHEFDDGIEADVQPQETDLYSDVSSLDQLGPHHGEATEECVPPEEEKNLSRWLVDHAPPKPLQSPDHDNATASNGEFTALNQRERPTGEPLLSRLNQTPLPADAVPPPKPFAYVQPRGSSGRNDPEPPREHSGPGSEPVALISESPESVGEPADQAGETHAEPEISDAEPVERPAPVSGYPESHPGEPSTLAKGSLRQSDLSTEEPSSAATDITLERVSLEPGEKDIVFERAVTLKLTISPVPDDPATSSGDHPAGALPEIVVDSLHGSQQDFQKLAEAIQDEGTDAIAEAIASQIDDAIITKLLEFWPVYSQLGLAEAAADSDGLDDELHQLPADSFSKLVPDDPFDVLRILVENAPIAFVDSALGSIKLGAEIAGVVLCVLAGNPLWTCACFKALVHDLVHRLLAAEIKRLLLGGSSETSDASGSPPPKPAVAPQPTPYRAINPDQRALTNPAQRPTALAGPGGSPRHVHETAGHSKPAIRAGERGGQPASHKATDALPQAETREKFTFTRLRLYYCLAGTAASKDHKDSRLPPHVAKLILVRDSSPVTISLASGQVIDQNITELAGYLAGRLNQPVSTEAWQLRHREYGEWFALGPPVTPRLITTLSQAPADIPPMLGDEAYFLEEVPTRPSGYVVAPDMRCTEIITLTPADTKDIEWQCLGIRVY